MKSETSMSIVLGLILLLVGSAAQAVMVKWATIDHSSQGPGLTVKLTVDPQGVAIKSIIQDPLTVYKKCPPSQPHVSSPNGWAGSLKAGPMVYIKGPATQNDVTFTFEVPMAREPCLT